MSVLQSPEARVQEVIEHARGPTRCRIPQRLPTKGKGLPNANLRPKGLNCPENGIRPKSANRIKDELFSGRTGHPTSRVARVEKSGLRRPATTKRMSLDSPNMNNKGGRPAYIMVPTFQNQRASGKTAYGARHDPDLPDQETIKLDEELELRQSPDNLEFTTNEDKESVSSRSDKLVKLKITWQDKIIQYEKYKQDLKDRQRAMLELYASLRNTHREMSTLGEEGNLPSAEDLRIMNVCRLTPEQLLHLCSQHSNMSMKNTDSLCKMNIAVDMNKVSNIPAKLIEASEQILLKRKEIIEWFESLLAEERRISIQHLSKIISKFKGENDMLKGSLDQLKIEFQKELEEIIQCLRKSASDAMALQLRSEQLTYELAELNSQNADLRKRLNSVDGMRSYTNKYKWEELEKELKDEKCKGILIKNKLIQTEGQLKINVDRAKQLETALDQARSQTWNLERTVQRLNEKNQKLQNDFDKELIKWEESMKLLESHTANIEEIAEDRNKLQAEKEDLEKKLAELSSFYNESLNNVKCDLNTNTTKLIETEKKYDLSCEEKKKLEDQAEKLCAKLLETELHLKDTVKELKEKDILLNDSQSVRKDLEDAKRQIEAYYTEVEEYKTIVAKQNETINNIERKLKVEDETKESLTNELVTKDEYITELENKVAIVEKQLQENEDKMEAYVSQLSQLKNHITQLQEDFGEFQTLDELHEIVNNHRGQLLEATRQNGELAEALQKKEEELEQYSHSLAQQAQLLEQRDGIIKMFTDKEQEQTNIIKILRNTIELRSQADNDLNQQVMEKNAEIQSLITNVETRKKQISNLEKIILTLEDQTRKANKQKKKDQDEIAMLQKRLAQVETYHMDLGHRVDAPVENLDNLIKKLEDELGSPLEPQYSKENNFTLPKKKYSEHRKRDGEMNEGQMNVPLFRSHGEGYPTKIVMGNFVKKTYIPNKDEQYEGDNLDRKRAITCIDTQKWTSPNPILNVPTPKTEDLSRGIVPNLSCKEPYITRNTNVLLPNPLRDERKYKMFKFAGHRLS